MPRVVRAAAAAAAAAHGFVCHWSSAVVSSDPSQHGEVVHATAPTVRSRYYRHLASSLGQPPSPDTWLTPQISIYCALLLLYVSTHHDPSPPILTYSLIATSSLHQWQAPSASKDNIYVRVTDSTFLMNILQVDHS